MSYLTIGSLENTSRLVDVSLNWTINSTGWVGFWTFWLLTWWVRWEIREWSAQLCSEGVQTSANWDGQDLARHSHGWPDMGSSGQPEFIQLRLARRKQVSNLGVRSAPPVGPTSQILHACMGVRPDLSHTYQMYYCFICREFQNFGKSILVFTICNFPFEIQSQYQYSQFAIWNHHCKNLIYSH